MIIVVSDSSPIISLAAVGRLDLLRSLYHQIIIPEAVYQEIIKDRVHRPGFTEVSQADWIFTKSISDQKLSNILSMNLHKGEAEAIVLATELRANLLLVDERKGRTAAKRLGVEVVGVLGVLMEAKHKNLLSCIKPILEDLWFRAGFRISETLYQKVLQEANEDRPLDS